MGCPLKEDCLTYFLPKETFTNVVYKILFPAFGTVLTAVFLYAWGEITDRSKMKSDIGAINNTQQEYLESVKQGQKQLSEKLDKLLAALPK